jgi:hypothetical protein
MVTLCGRDGKPVTSGSLLTAPFVWSAISSTAAPDGYTRAYLLVFQPIQYVDPSNWSGYQLTGPAIYSKAAHPVAQATNADEPLFYADNSYPPRWDGLYEIRMYFSAPTKPPENSIYPMAVIRVSGRNWTLVSGGTTPCNAGSGIAVEALRLPKAELDTPQSLVLSTPTTVPSQGATSGTTRAPIVFPSPLPRAQASGANRSGSGSNDDALWVGIPVGAAAVGGAGYMLYRRHRLPH